MAKKSYDTSSNFSTNQKGMIRDQFDYSPAQNENYNYKDCYVGGVKMGEEYKGKPGMNMDMSNKMNMSKKD